MATGQSEFEPLPHRLARSVHDRWVWFLIKGIVLVALGVLALMVPVLATIAFTTLIGWLFLASGIVGLIATFQARHAPGFWWSLLSAVLGCATGVLLLASPLGAAISITLLLIAYFALDGIFSIMFALDHRRDLPGQWGWMLASGIVNLILSGLVLAGLPGTAIFGLGLLVAINLLFGGVSLIAMALRARTLFGADQR